MKSFRIACLALLLVALWPAAAMSARAQAVGCRGAPPLIGTANIIQSTCFTVTPTRGSTALRLDLAVGSGAYDLYVRLGSASLLNDTDKVNVGAVSGALSFVLANPGAGPYTVAVTRTSGSGNARLSSVPYQAPVKCSNTTCSVSYALASMPGSRYGDQAIFQVGISKPGRIDVRATWQGTARLSVLLYGPTVSKMGVTQTSFARKDGGGPLALAYDVRSNNLIPGGKWSVGLTNAGKGGGVVTSGALSITYPR